MIQVSEIFKSIQGEGPSTGIPTVFLRLDGCPVGCSWCDSKYTWKPNGTLWEPKALLRELKTYGSNLHLCVTGGEPVARSSEELEEVSDIVHYWEGYTTLFTSAIGEEMEAVQDFIGGFHEVVVDVKCPSSGVVLPLGYKGIVRDWLIWEGVRVFSKFIVKDREDCDFVLSTNFPEDRVIISPEWGLANTEFGEEYLHWLSKFTLDNNYRLSLQVHKYIWGLSRGH